MGCTNTLDICEKVVIAGGSCSLCKLIALVALLLEQEEGFCWKVAFVETFVLIVYVVPNLWLKIL